MNPENDTYRLIIKSNISPERRIHSTKYFSLMLTMIILGGMDQIQTTQCYQIFLLDYMLPIIGIIIAILYTCFYQFIGHRRLYIISFIFLSLLFILIKDYYIYPLSYSLSLVFRSMLYSQIMIQIYGTWPHKFGKIFAQMLYSQIMMRQIIRNMQSIFQENLIIQKYGNDLFYWILIAMIFVNFIWLVCGLFVKGFISIVDFKSTENNRIFQEFGGSLYNIKSLIFTLLYFDTIASLKIQSFFQKINFNEFYLDSSDTFIISVISIFLFLSIILILLFLLNQNLKPSLMILSIFSLLVIESIICQMLLKINYIYHIDISIYMIICYIQLLMYLGIVKFVQPQYWQILINIGIRILDFVSQQLSGVELSQTFKIYIIIPSLITIIIALSIIFRQTLGLKKYIRRTNISSVEKDSFQIEIF